MSAEKVVWPATTVPCTRRGVEAGQTTEKVASIWLTTLPIEENGFILNKGEFHDALYLRYALDGTQEDCHKCAFVESHSRYIGHSMICSYGGFPTMHHNELRDLTAKWISEGCYNVGTEPPLQSLSGERLQQKSSTRRMVFP